MTNQIHKPSLKNLISIASGFTIAIVAAYCWLLPSLFNGYQTYSIIVIGALASAFFAWFTSFKSLDSSAGSKRIILPICYGLAIAVLVVFVSLLFIVNVRGS